jgi:hypothetical protein
MRGDFTINTRCKSVKPVEVVVLVMAGESLGSKV